MKVYIESPNMFSYLRLQFQVNQISKRHRNTGQHRLYEFCYLLPFNLWTFYLANILSLQRCAGLGNFLVLQGYLMSNNINFMCGMDSILLWNSYCVWKQLFFSYYSRNLSLNKFPS